MMMTVSEDKLISVIEYAKLNCVSKQSVHTKIRKNEADLRGHVFKKKNKVYIDEYAQKYLVPCKENIYLINKADELQKTLDTRSADFENNERIVKEQSVRIAELTAENKKNLRVIDEYRERCSSYENRISDLRRENTEKDNTITELQQSIAELTAAVTALTERVAVVENINTHINTLFAVFEDSANSGLAKKLGNLIKGKESGN